MPETYIEAAGVKKRRYSHADFFIRLVKEKPLGTIGGIIIVIVLFTGIFADQLAPYHYNKTNLRHRLAPSSSEHILGTDNLGRDLFSRIIYGARTSMLVGVVGGALATLVATIIGLVSGFIGGRFDTVTQRFVDAWMCFPGLVIILTVMSLIGPGLVQVIVVLGLLYGVTMSRVIRGAVIAIRENLYVTAAAVTGCSTGRILIRHILPNVTAVIIIVFTTRMSMLILVEASLSFLGFGVPPPMPSWGGMLSGSGIQYMLVAPWMAIWPGVALGVVVYGINMFGDALRDLLDPKLRGGLGRFTASQDNKAQG